MPGSYQIQYIVRCWHQSLCPTTVSDSGSGVLPSYRRHRFVSIRCQRTYKPWIALENRTLEGSQHYEMCSFVVTIGNNWLTRPPTAYSERNCDWWVGQSAHTERNCDCWVGLSAYSKWNCDWWVGWSAYSKRNCDWWLGRSAYSKRNCDWLSWPVDLF